MKKFYIKKSCRLCQSSKLKLVLPLKPSPLCDAYTKYPKNQKNYPLNLLQCHDCKFVQIDCVVNPQIIYKEYIYVTTSSMGLCNHFSSYALYCAKSFGFKKQSRVLDIGSNDGTLLRAFKKLGFKTFGIEPATKVASIASKNGIKTLPKFFNSRTARQVETEFGKADIVTINNLFANIDDLSGFLKSLNKVISPNGIVVIESSYLYSMIKNMVFDFIYHEHLSYFSILPLIKFFSKFNFKLIDVVKVNTKGGSLRYVWAKTNSDHKKNIRVAQSIRNEQKICKNNNLFKNFKTKIDITKKKILRIIKKKKYKKIIGYGASATSTTLISHFGLSKLFAYLVDENPAKINTFSPGYKIPVFSEKKLNSDKPDLIIILAWRYYKSIIKKINSSTGPFKVIIPLPRIKEISIK